MPSADFCLWSAAFRQPQSPSRHRTVSWGKLDRLLCAAAGSTLRILIDIGFQYVPSWSNANTCTRSCPSTHTFTPSFFGPRLAAVALAFSLALHLHQVQQRLRACNCWQTSTAHDEGPPETRGSGARGCRNQKDLESVRTSSSTMQAATPPSLGAGLPSRNYEIARNPVTSLAAPLDECEREISISGGSLVVVETDLVGSRRKRIAGPGRAHRIRGR